MVHGMKTMIAWLILITPSLGAQQAAVTDDAASPNVVIILTDDQGYADVGCFGAEGFQTPNLDRMAAEGMRFTDFHVSQAVCSASRASLLTGCYAERVSIQGALSAASSTGLNPEEETIAEVLKARGYATGIFGKWHLGYQESFLPLSQGFDEFFGLPYSNDMWPVDFDGVSLAGGSARKSWYPALRLIDGSTPGEAVETLEDQARLTGLYTERAVRFIEENRERPFFLYLPHSMPHVPLGASKAFRGRSEQGAYGDVIMEIDWSVGRILAALEEHGLSERTLVIFASDNGPWLNFGDHAGSAGPLREGKGAMWEGGARVPCLMRWPGRIPAGSVCNELAATIDLLPTIATLAGAALPERPIDGVDIGSLLAGEFTDAPRETYAYYYGGFLVAVRRGTWKLVLPHDYRSYEGVEPGRNGHPGPYAKGRSGLELYDLQTDRGETQDVAAEHPGLVAELQVLAEQTRVELGDRSTNARGAGVRPPGRLVPLRPSPVVHLALEKSVTLGADPSGHYWGGGSAGLVDGVLGSDDCHDGRWLGYEDRDFEALVDLATETTLSHITCSFLLDQRSWIFLPRTLELAISSDGQEFEVIGSFAQPPDADPGQRAREYDVALDSRSARFVRVRASNVGTCPEWHPGAGGKAWVFVDEIVVE